MKSEIGENLRYKINKISHQTPKGINIKSNLSHEAKAKYLYNA